MNKSLNARLKTLEAAYVQPGGSLNQLSMDEIGSLLLDTAEAILASPECTEPDRREAWRVIDGLIVEATATNTFWACPDNQRLVHAARSGGHFPSDYEPPVFSNGAAEPETAPTMAYRRALRQRIHELKAAREQSGAPAQGHSHAA